MKKEFYVRNDAAEVKNQESLVLKSRADFSIYAKSGMQDAKVNAFAKIGSCDGNDTMFVMECDIEKANEVTKEWDAVRKRRKVNQNSGYMTVSLSEYDNEEECICGDEIITDETVNVEEEAVKNVMIEEMLKAIKNLPDDERDLIESLYLSGGFTEKSYGKANGMSQQTVHNKKNRILKKLRIMLEGVENQ